MPSSYVAIYFIDESSQFCFFEVERLATVQVTSEDPAFPIESVFRNNGGWRAAKEGEQVIRLVFDEPQRFIESGCAFQKWKSPEPSNSLCDGRALEDRQRSFASNGMSILTPAPKNWKTIG